MPNIPYLTKRRETWYARVRIPADLVTAYNGRKEIQKTLKTRDHKEARNRVTSVKADIEAEFQIKRNKLKVQQSNADMLSGFSDHDLKALSHKWLHRAQMRLEEARIKDTSGWTEERLREYAIELQHEEWLARQECLGNDQSDAHDGMTTACKMLNEEGITYQPGSPQLMRLGYYFSKAIHTFVKMKLDEWNGKASPAIALSGYQTIAAPKRKNAIRMKELYKEYFDNPSRKRGASTIKNYTIIMRAIDELIGEDTFAHEITRDQCKEIRSLLIESPSNAIKKTKAKTMKEAAAMGKALKLPPLEDTTVNMHLQKLSAIMKYALQENYIDQNPAVGLAVQEKTKSSARRLPFDQEQLNKIFNAPLYTGCQDGERGYNEPGAEKPRNARFWVPLISLWTGMRLNEICQLDVTDIGYEKDVPLIHIRCGDEPEDSNDVEKRVKTEAGIRFVPIHPILERIGLMEFVEERRKSNHRLLFNELNPGPYGGYSHGFSSWFRRFMENIEARKPKTAFHSFRHCYRDALREAELPMNAALQLGGWSRGTTDADYGQGLKAKTLYNHIQKISYPELKLSHLYK